VALGISILVQSIERFIHIEHVEDPKLVLIMGCIGLTLNLISAVFLHEHHGHDHGHGHSHGEDSPVSTDSQRASASAELSLSEGVQQHAEHRHNVVRIKAPGRDLGMLGVLVHVLSDALNNVGVIIAALVIWLTDYEDRFYADPGTSMGIAIMIFLSSIPLVKNSGAILLQSAPRGVDLGDIKHDLEKVCAVSLLDPSQNENTNTSPQIPGIESVHELHVWRLDQKKAIATAHVVVSDQTVSEFMEKAKTVSECLHAYGIHSATIQPELVIPSPPSESETLVTSSSTASASSGTVRRRQPQREGASPIGACHLLCGKGICENLMCCTTPVSVQL
jgi:zinc transporter 1